MTDSGPGNGILTAGGRWATLRWGLRSDPGQLRTNNEDFAGVVAPDGAEGGWDRSPMFVVADGMGGHASGEVASSVAVTVALESWSSGPPGANALRGALRSANLAVFDMANKPEHRGMGTTITALCFEGNQAAVAHVGDSRAYLVHGASCTQLTSDHSRVAEMVRMRMLSPEKAADHPLRSQLTRSLGSEPLVQVDLTRHAVERNDVLVLCSDGLWDLVSRAEIAQAVLPLQSEHEEARGAASTLVDLALARGAPDNVTAVVVAVTSDPPIAPEARRSFFRRRS
jgi:serine/threonine protein phosphatase PrpC